MISKLVFTGTLRPETSLTIRCVAFPCSARDCKTGSTGAECCSWLDLYCHTFPLGSSNWNHPITQPCVTHTLYKLFQIELGCVRFRQVETKVEFQFGNSFRSIFLERGKRLQFSCHSGSLLVNSTKYFFASSVIWALLMYSSNSTYSFPESCTWVKIAAIAFLSNFSPMFNVRNPSYVAFTMVWKLGMSL